MDAHNAEVPGYILKGQKMKTLITICLLASLLLVQGCGEEACYDRTVISGEYEHPFASEIVKQPFPRELVMTPGNYGHPFLPEIVR